VNFPPSERYLLSRRAIDVIRLEPAQLMQKHLDAGEVEAALIARIAGRDRSALEALYGRYQRPLFRYLCQLTPDRGLAEEILQDTLLAVWQSAAAFQRRSSPRAWLFGVARRQAHNTLRRRGIPPAGDAQVGDVPDQERGPEAQALAAADRETLAAAIERLSPLHREALALAFVEGLAYAEIAALLEIPEGTVKSRLSNARRALRAELGATLEADR
jgi:RNA polymerase sigma factor (sigma-70 family)